MRISAARRSAQQRARRAMLGSDGVLRVSGQRGADERDRYLSALARDVISGECEQSVAVAELHELSEPWMRSVVRSRIRRLPSYVDSHTTEHRLWMEWHESLLRFDPERVDTFPAYVNLRVRMAVSAAAREDDPLPRQARMRLRRYEFIESQLVQDLGRQLTYFERQQLVESIIGEWLPVIHARLVSDDLVRHDAAWAHPDPAEEVERASLGEAVRAALAANVHKGRDRLLSWVEAAEGHGRAPSLRVSVVPEALRAALAPWVHAADELAGGASSAA